MQLPLKALVMATVLTGVGVSAVAYQDGGHTMDGSPHMERHPRMDPARMEEMHARRSADLKTKLHITPAQEGAWTAFVAAMKPPVRDAAPRMDYAALSKLPTPERLDKMHALRTQHMNEMNAAMDKRAQATKDLYATLSAEQKKLFDAESGRMRANHGGHGM